MNLHPVTWAVLALALIGLYFVLSIIVPILLVLAIIVAWRKIPSIQIKEALSYDRVRIDSVHRDLSRHGQDS